MYTDNLLGLLTVDCVFFIRKQKRISSPSSVSAAAVAPVVCLILLWCRACNTIKIEFVAFRTSPPRLPASDCEAICVVKVFISFASFVAADARAVDRWEYALRSAVSCDGWVGFTATSTKSKITIVHSCVGDVADTADASFESRGIHRDQRCDSIIQWAADVLEIRASQRWIAKQLRNKRAINGRISTKATITIFGIGFRVWIAEVFIYLDEILYTFFLLATLMLFN